MVDPSCVWQGGRVIHQVGGFPPPPPGPDPELCPTRDPPVRVSGTRHWTYYVPIHTPALHIHGPRRTSGLMEVRCFQYHANCWIQLGSLDVPEYWSWLGVLSSVGSSLFARICLQLTDRLQIHERLKLLWSFQLLEMYETKSYFKAIYWYLCLYTRCIIKNGTESNRVTVNLS